MSIIQGDVVIATAGKEKNKIFVVVSTDGSYCYIVDGKRLKISKPKKKSLKHVQRASKTPFPKERLDIKEEKINAEIRKFLKERMEYVKTRCN